MSSIAAGRSAITNLPAPHRSLAPPWGERVADRPGEGATRVTFGNTVPQNAGQQQSGHFALTPTLSRSHVTPVSRAPSRGRGGQARDWADPGAIVSHQTLRVLRQHAPESMTQRWHSVLVRDSDLGSCGEAAPQSPSGLLHELQLLVGRDILPGLNFTRRPLDRHLLEAFDSSQSPMEAPVARRKIAVGR